MYIGLHVKYPLFLSDFNEFRIFFTVSKNSQISAQWVPSCSMRTDRHDETNSRFSQFFERASKLLWSPCRFRSSFLLLLRDHEEFGTYVGTRVPTFRDNLFVLSSRVKYFLICVTNMRSGTTQKSADHTHYAVRQTISKPHPITCNR
jgi:hypothetical protein